MSRLHVSGKWKMSCLLGSSTGWKRRGFEKWQEAHILFSGKKMCFPVLTAIFQTITSRWSCKTCSLPLCYMAFQCWEPMQPIWLGYKISSKAELSIKHQTKHLTEVEVSIYPAFFSMLISCQPIFSFMGGISPSLAAIPLGPTGVKHVLLFPTITEERCSPVHPSGWMN